MDNNTRIHTENIPTALNSASETRANAQHQHWGAADRFPDFSSDPVIPAQPLTMVPGSRAGCEPLSKTIDSLTGEARVYGQSQLNNANK